LLTDFAVLIPPRTIIYNTIWSNVLEEKDCPWLGTSAGKPLIIYLFSTLVYIDVYRTYQTTVGRFFDETNHGANGNRSHPL
jgi:hypothetical protein